MELTYLATGAYQHVFVRADVDEPWVYKLPAAFGYLRPYAEHWPKVPPAPTLRGAVRVMLNPRASAAASAPWRSAAALGARIHAPLLRRRRRAEFTRNLALLQRLPPAARAVLLPFRILSAARATLRVGDATRGYRGPILVQRRADFLLPGEAVLLASSFVAAAQYALWASGVGLSEVHEVLGSRGWARLDGRMFLGDTSSLTRTRGAVRRCLRTGRLHAEMGRLLRMVDGIPEAAPSLAALCDALRLEMFDRLWRAPFFDSARRG